jgi:long-chain acyl-CoA synthetase
MLTAELLDAGARRHADAPYLIVGERTHSYGSVARQSDGMAATLAAAGLRRGDRVVCLLENSAEFVVALWATWKAGGVFVPLPANIGTDRLAFVLADCAPHSIFAPVAARNRVTLAMAQGAVTGNVLWVADTAAGGGLSALVTTAAAPRAGGIDQDLCLILYTSGSTGEPKGVMLTHHNVRNNAWAIATYLDNRPGDVVLSALPLSFSYGLFQVITAAHAGCAVAIERSFAYPLEVLQRIAAVKATGFPGVPTTFATLLRVAREAGVDLSSLRYVTNAGAALSPAHLQELRALLPNARMVPMYGLTECTRVSYLDASRLDEKTASVGRAIPNLEAAVVDEQGREVPRGAVGELVVRGSGIMRGYWRRPAETAKALREGPGGERWLFTGDLFRMDPDGDLFFVGRKDDMFKCRGEKVYPSEIENVLFELDAVREAAVVGVADTDDGYAIKAFVVPHEGASLTPEQIRRHCRERLERRLTPRFIDVCAALPTTASGKVAKRALRVAAE